MIILDTNILSELMRSSPERKVVDWIVRHGAEGLRTTAVCQAEILAGIAVLPSGRRRRDLEQGASEIFSNVLRDKVLPFDSNAASHFGIVVARRRTAGLQSKPPDAMIAAVALAHGAVVATRNIADFTHCGVTLHDPWSEAP